MDFVITNALAAAEQIFQLKTMILLFTGVLAGLVAGAIPGFTIAMAVIRA